MVPGVTYLVCGLATERDDDTRICSLALQCRGTLPPAYHFWADWEFRHARRGALLALDVPCRGVPGAPAVLRAFRSYGSVNSVQQVPGEVALRGLGMRGLACHLYSDKGYGDAAVHRDVPALGIPLMVCGPTRVSSVFCAGVARGSELSCAACAAVTLPREDRLAAIRVRVNKVQSAADITAAAGVLDSAKDRDLTHVELRVKMEAIRAQRDVHARRLGAARVKVRDMGNLAPCARRAHDACFKLAIAARTTSDFAYLCEHMLRARDMGAFEQAGSDELVIKSVLQGVALGPNRDERGRRHDPALKAVFANILLYGGPRVHDYVSGLWRGPSIATTRRTLTEYAGDNRLYMWDSQRADEVATSLAAFDLAEAPCIMAEDATALIPHASGVVRKVDKRHVVQLVGTVGGPVAFRTWDDIEEFKTVVLSARDAVVSREAVPPGAPRLATLLHVFLVVPLVEGAPAIVFHACLLDGTRDAYNATWVGQKWLQGDRWLRDKGVKLVGHTGDGASAFR